jgi:hypothetical protein
VICNLIPFFHIFVSIHSALVITVLLLWKGNLPVVPKMPAADCIDDLHPKVALQDLELADRDK